MTRNLAMLLLSVVLLLSRLILIKCNDKVEDEVQAGAIPPLPLEEEEGFELFEHSIHSSSTSTVFQDLADSNSTFPSSLPSVLLSTAPSALQNQPTPVPTRPPMTGKPTKKPAAVGDNNNSQRLNVLIITADQFRYDAMRFVQNKLPVYKNKLKIRTPNLDQLAKEGVYFENAYAQSSSCTPSRATLRSGCTMERTGIQSPFYLDSYKTDPVVAKKVLAIRTYDQLLSHVGYQAESYGKFHTAERWYYEHDNPAQQAITYDTYAKNFERPEFRGLLNSNVPYIQQVTAWAAKDKRQKTYTEGQQTNIRSRWPYTPIRLDPRYGDPKEGPTKGVTEDTIFGIDSLPSNYSMSAYTGRSGKLAIQRLAKTDKPWVLTVSFENPHPPYVVSEEYASYYLEHKKDLLIPPNMHQRIQNDFYAKAQVRHAEEGFQLEDWVQEWTAIYYGMVEQVDAWIGVLLRELKRQKVDRNTLVVFTSDHGEFLGGHGMQGKIGLFEDSLRVPMLMRLPGKIKAGTAIYRPVSHLDVFPTIMDYTGYKGRDNSDGTSLRPAINRREFRQDYENNYAVGEVDLVSESGNLGNAPNFMIRHGRYKLMMTKLASSETQDLMFDLKTDPFEIKNLLYPKKVARNVIGKAEHLKILLLEWLRRNDGGESQYYSLPKYNFGEGRGDIQEITDRRTWPAVNQWQSDHTIQMDTPVFVEGKWRSNAWLYIGRTTSGVLNVTKISAEGLGQQYFTLSTTSGKVRQNQHLRVKLAFASSANVKPGSLNVRIVIESDVDKRRVVYIQPWSNA